MKSKILMAVAAGVLLLPGCTAQPADPPASVPPSSAETQLQDEVDCLVDLGYEANVTSDGGIEAHLAPSQTTEQFSADQQLCRAEAGITLDDSPLTSDELKDVYAQTLVTRLCLIDQGYDMPEPPTEQYFLDNYYTDPYLPYAFLPQETITQEEVERLYLECPQPSL